MFNGIDVNEFRRLVARPLEWSDADTGRAMQISSALWKAHQEMTAALAANTANALGLRLDDGHVIECRCDRLEVLMEKDAEVYSDRHLEPLPSPNDDTSAGWEKVRRCPETGSIWIEDKPHNERHGGGPTRLRRIT